MLTSYENSVVWKQFSDTYDRDYVCSTSWPNRKWVCRSQFHHYGYLLVNKTSSDPTMSYIRASYEQLRKCCHCTRLRASSPSRFVLGGCIHAQDYIGQVTTLHPQCVRVVYWGGGGGLTPARSGQVVATLRSKSLHRTHRGPSASPNRRPCTLTLTILNF